jgi:hypothetical protein
MYVLLLFAIHETSSNTFLQARSPLNPSPSHAHIVPSRSMYVKIQVKERCFQRLSRSKTHQ